MANPIKLSLLTAFLFIILLRIPVSAFQYAVNGENGWVVPNVGDALSYNHWASRNRFKIRDSVRFIYINDSVMEVTGQEYEECYSPYPIYFDNSGDTVVELNRSGSFYFISGVSTHCKKGQKMIIKVLSIPSNAPSQSPSEPPSSSPTNGTDAVPAPATPKSSDAVSKSNICLVLWPLWARVSLEPGKGKEKTERKTAKAEEKKARRESKKVSEDDDIDAILRNIQREEAKKKEVHMEENVPVPSPRSNCSLTINPLKESELILYGGEFYNGKKTYVYGDLYRYDTEKNEWKQISSPNSPPPRSAHQAVAWKDHLYIFGGEFTSPNQERFHHYKDFWTLDLKTNQWEQLLLKGCPTARSGHRMCYTSIKLLSLEASMILLEKYYNDLFVFDLDLFKWQEIKPKLGCMWPTPRSAFQVSVFQDEILLYGGYSKVVSSDTNSSEKGIVHSDMWSLDPRTWEWSKVKKGGMPPGPRAGFSMCLHKKRAVLFGGVVDKEVEGDVLLSLFLNELYGFQLDCHRWYPLELRKDKPSKDKAKGGKKSESISNEGGSENVTNCDKNEIIPKSVGGHDSINEVAHLMCQDFSIHDGVVADRKIGETNGSSKLQECSSNEAVKPCGRINSCMVVGRDTLYLYGGMMEIKDQEITLDDLYSLNLSKLDEWKCIIPASVSEWVEASDEDEDEEDDNDTDDEDGDDNGSNNEESDDDANEGGDVESAVALLKGEKKSLRRKEKKARIEQIRATLGLSDSLRTPVSGESLKDFYKRTNSYWQMAAYEHTQHTGKELRKDGFDLAESRFKELKPILDELAILEAEQKVREEEVGECSNRKRGGGDKKNKRH